MGKAKEWLSFDADRFRQVLDRALSLSNAPPLVPIEHMGRDAWRVSLPDHDSAWTDTADTLRKPKDRRMSRDEWRKTNAIRPVVFEDNGLLDGEAGPLPFGHPPPPPVLRPRFG